MKFLLAQINPVVGDLEGNAKKYLLLLRKLAQFLLILFLLQNYHYGDIRQMTYFLKKI